MASATNDIENEDDEEDNNEDAGHDLSSEDIGMIKRRIANVLEPGETVHLNLPSVIVCFW